MYADVGKTKMLAVLGLQSSVNTMMTWHVQKKGSSDEHSQRLYPISIKYPGTGSHIGYVMMTNVCWTEKHHNCANGDCGCGCHRREI